MCLQSVVVAVVQAEDDLPQVMVEAEAADTEPHTLHDGCWHQLLQGLSP